jgi:TrkA domain protein
VVVGITSRVLPGIGVCQQGKLRDRHHIGNVTKRSG